jgi:hypothetical protein
MGNRAHLFAVVCVGLGLIVAACSGDGQPPPSATPPTPLPASATSQPTPSPTPQPVPPEATATRAAGILIEDAELGFRLYLSEEWVPAFICTTMDISEPLCGSISRPVSPAEYAAGFTSQPLFAVAYELPVDPTFGIQRMAGQYLFNGIYISVRRRGPPASENDYLARLDERMPDVIAYYSDVGAELLEQSAASISGHAARRMKYAVPDWGPCIFASSATTCDESVGRTWDQAYIVAGELVYLVSCEGAQQGSRLNDEGQVELTDELSAREAACQIAFDTFTLSDQ